MKEKLKTWAPVAGSIILIGTVALRLFGHGELAAAIETGAAAVGLTGQSSLSAADTAGVITQAAGAAVAVWGIARKVRSEVQKARESYVTPPASRKR